MSIEMDVFFNQKLQSYIEGSDIKKEAKYIESFKITGNSNIIKIQAFD